VGGDGAPYSRCYQTRPRLLGPSSALYQSRLAACASPPSLPQLKRLLPVPLFLDYKRSFLPKTPTSFIMRNATNPFSTSIPSHAHPPSLPPTAPPTVARARKPKQLCFLQHANGHDKDPSLQSRSSKSFANSTVFADPWLFGKRGT
jgi:hypothetical protein